MPALFSTREAVQVMDNYPVDGRTGSRTAAIIRGQVGIVVEVRRAIGRWYYYVKLREGRVVGFQEQELHHVEVPKSPVSFACDDRVQVADTYPLMDPEPSKRDKTMRGKKGYIAEIPDFDNPFYVVHLDCQLDARYEFYEVELEPVT